MSEVILAKVVQTCAACPSQWDAWDVDGDYWYLRYRHGRGTAERQPSPDWREWHDGPPNISFDGEAAGMADGWISFEDFCHQAGLDVHPGADLRLYEDAQ